ncbi:MAG: SDR family NAD(P)-dependent oxidoreductase [Candidatus Geothermincolia bacterium]
MRRPMDLRGKKVLITGAASGIGFSTAKEFARRQAVPILIDIDVAGLDTAVASLRDAGYQAYGYATDITDIIAVRARSRELEMEGLGPDVLVNCAGLTLVCHTTTCEYEDWTRIIDVNVMGTVNIVHTFLPAMIRRGYGHIANIGSIDGIIPVPGQAAYCGSKFAITGLTEVLHFDLKRDGIGVTLVLPGYVNTPMARALPVRDMNFEFKGSGLAIRAIAAFGNSPHRIARHIVDGVVHNRFLVIPGWPSRLIYHFKRLFPRLSTSAGLGTARFFDVLRRRLV